MRQAPQSSPSLRRWTARSLASTHRRGSAVRHSATAWANRRSHGWPVCCGDVMQTVELGGGQVRVEDRAKGRERQSSRQSGWPLCLRGDISAGEQPVGTREPAMGEVMERSRAGPLRSEPGWLVRGIWSSPRVEGAGRRACSGVTGVGILETPAGWWAVERSSGGTQLPHGREPDVCPELVAQVVAQDDLVRVGRTFVPAAIGAHRHEIDLLRDAGQHPVGRVDAEQAVESVRGDPVEDARPAHDIERLGVDVGEHLPREIAADEPLDVVELTGGTPGRAEASSHVPQMQGSGPAPRAAGESDRLLDVESVTVDVGEELADLPRSERQIVGAQEDGWGELVAGQVEGRHPSTRQHHGHARGHVADHPLQCLVTAVTAVRSTQPVDDDSAHLLPPLQTRQRRPG